MADTRLKFITQQATVSAGTWAAIGQHKLEHMKLGTGPFEIQGVLPPAAFHRGSGQDSAVTFDQVQIFSSAADRDPEDASECSVAVPCSVYALNNLEDTADGALCASLLSEACENLREAIISGSAFQNVQELFRSLLIVHANLKSHVYTHAFAFPFLKLAQPFKLLSCAPAASALPAHTAAELATLYKCGEPILVQNLPLDRTTAASTQLEVLPWSALSKGSEGSETWPEGATVVMADTSCYGGVLGWPLRNLCALLATHFPGRVVDVVAIRTERGTVSVTQSLLLKILLPESPDTEHAAAAGWHSTTIDQGGQRVPKMVQVPLAGSLDPEVQAHEAMKLNLQLMTWRAAPDINLPLISGLHCLVLGCGTLGCEVARTLVSWGVQKITLVDNGKVAFSNPARQSLFTVQDCKDGGALKAEAAAAALASIAPKLDVDAVPMSIPMPGHPPAPSELDETRYAIRQLHELIEAADVVFLLTDSRESRWLPTLQAAASRTLLINSALAFDSWVTMRHGVRDAQDTAQPCPDGDTVAAAGTSQSQPTAGAQPGFEKVVLLAERLGCYFCNDVVAPANSLARRSMDQQCTVVRPGLARVAAAHAVEMLAALSQHEDFGGAPVGDARSGGVLGGVPHMLRGTFMGFEQTHMHGVATAACSACGDGVVNAYEQESEELVMKVLQDQNYVEVVSGLQALRMHGNASEGKHAEDADGMEAGLGSDEDDWLAL